MRIIGGELKRTVIPSPPGDATRPTMDRIRESIFDVLEGNLTLQTARVLDLYAGSGILSWEALSRGAQSTIMVDSSVQICRHLRAVAMDLGVSERVQIVRTDCLAYLRNATVDGIQLLFADPPYALRHCNSILGILEESPLLSDDALVVLEHGDQEYVVPTERFRAVWHGSGGACVVDIFQRVGPVA
ncbi:MAG: 16S rRNA (guanine(966)-N(2))-methyltransferase RsmD [Candidatus Kapabacteria bacterium]|nr:16S rRNA (guanine(966)-N(2))-methyltransferase RsmD [Candidatus Kapabacteria bacterium]